MNNIGVRSSQR